MNSFSTLWVGNSLGHYEKLSLKSAIETGKNVTLYSYEELADIPHGVMHSDASLILPRTSAVEKMIKMRKFSGMANIFRYQMLRQESTIWFDLDVVFLKNEFPVSPYIFAYEDLQYINNAVLSYPQNSELSNLMVTRATIDEVCTGLRGSTGPKLLSKSITDLALEGYALPSESFYPVHWSEPWKFFHPGFFDIVSRSSRNSYAIHLWNDNLKFSGLNMKAQRPPTRSFMEHLFLTYNCEMPILHPLPVSEFDLWKESMSNSRSGILGKSRLLNLWQTIKNG